MKILRDYTRIVVVLSLAAGGAAADAGTEAEINLNVKHSVGGVSEFDRQKYMNAHSHLAEPDWAGEAELLDTLMTDLDVYFGRDNGSMIEYLKNADEDPKRPGYVDPEYLKVAGRLYRNIVYGNRHASKHKYDARNDVMIGGQPHAFLPNPGEEKTEWKLGGADAIGEYMGLFLNEFYRNEGEAPRKGQSRPRFVEILNEPLYHFIDGHRAEHRTAKSIFEFHNDAAKAIRRVNDEVLIGGPTLAFPILEERNFARWDERMKLFIDTSGEYMDFYSLHFYDFNNRGDRGRDDYKGSRLEATLDMLEQYSLLRLGEVKPFLISEYGGRDHTLENRAWTALRDWHFLKAATPLTIQFLDRPDRILKSIPFITAKAEWGRKNGIPYNRRLMHQVKERPGQMGDDWIFTDLVLFYELWSEVKGTRIKTESGNPDVLLDGYVEGSKAYVILGNLNPADETVALNLTSVQSNEVVSSKVKHLCRVADGPLLDVKKVKGGLESFTLKPEAGAIIEYTFENDVVIDEAVEERKYYATDYNRPIDAHQAVLFEIQDVKKGKQGEAVLRVGFGRATDRSRQPVVTFNGKTLEVAENYSGSDQPARPAFFGLLEIPVPYGLLKANNRVEITFPDSGGRVSSVTMKVFTRSMFSFTDTLDVLNALDIHGIEAYRGQTVGGGFDEPSNFNAVSQEAKDYMKRIAAEKGIEIRHYGVASARSPEEWRQFFEFAKEMGLKAIISEPEYDELEMVDALAQEFDLRVGIHNHPISTKYWHPDIVLHHLKGLSDHIGISMDTGNWARSGLDPLECMKKFRELEGRIVEVQLKDMAVGKFVPLGTGDSNVAGMLRELQRQNFKGPLTIEYFGKMTPEEKIREIRESLNYLYRVAYWMNKR